MEVGNIVHESAAAPCITTDRPLVVSGPSSTDSAHSDAERGIHLKRRLQTASELSDRLLAPYVVNSAEFFAPVLNVPRHFVQMLLVIEDKRFGLHFGVDLLSILRALISNLLHYGDLQGASTITQQLYDILKAQDDLAYARPRSLGRKIKQTCWSLQREFKDTKIGILREYLANVYWGNAYYGIDAACHGYFGLDRSSVSVAESFFLAERLANPNRIYSTRIESLLARPVVQNLLLIDGSSPREVRRIYEIQFLSRG